MEKDLWSKLVIETRYLCGDSQEEFAKRLGITQQTVSLWEKGQLPRKKAIDLVTELHGRVAINSPPAQISSMAENYGVPPTSQQEDSDKHEKDENEQTTIPEALVMTEDVLKSRTVYRSALMSNIKAFHKAVMGEEEMEKMHDRMDRMEQVNARLEHKMDEMLRAMAGVVGEKREFKVA